MTESTSVDATKAGELKHVRWSEIPVESLNPLFDRQLVVGTNIMVAKLSLRKGCVVPLHSHHNEQISHIVSGKFQFDINGKTIILHGGEFLCIPPRMPHSAVALEDTTGFDIFSPPREDWLNKTDQYLRR
jgi:quercetin dioxygenase-like cupin family protein